MTHTTIHDASHARLRARLLAAMGLVPACTSEPAFPGADAGTPGLADAAPAVPDARVDVDAAPTARDAGPTDDAAPTTHDAGSVSNVCPFGNGQPSRSCVSHETMVSLATWGGGMIVPQQPLRTPEQVAALFLPNGCLPPEYVQDGCCNPARGAGSPEGDSCCYEFCTGSCCGRPFLIDGQARTAHVEARDDWNAAAQPRLPEAAGLRAILASTFQADAQMEHASIAAFARFTLELLAFGAPAELVQAAQRAGLDETAHAHLCFGLASAYAGRALGPGSLAMAGVRPAASLRESVLCAVREGCIGETLAAARAATQLAQATDPAVRAVLARIVDDETRHAELAYRYVAWALAREPALREAVAECLASALGAAPAQDARAVPSASELASLRAAGWLSPADEARVRCEALAQVVAPCTRALLHAPAPQAPWERSLSRAHS